MEDRDAADLPAVSERDLRRRRLCPNCGAALSGAPTTAQAAPAPGAPGAAGRGRGDTGASTVPAYKFDAARWSLADRISGVATIVLFISLFLAWFGISVIGITVTASGVSAHGFLYLVMVICILIVAYSCCAQGGTSCRVASTFRTSRR